MILQALHQYYEREKDRLPKEGWGIKEIDFVVVVDIEGNCHAFDPLVEKIGKNWVGQPLTVPAIGPQFVKHDNSGKDANLLWDNVSFALGLGKNGRKKSRYFRRLLRDWFHGKTSDPAVLGLRRFLVRFARFRQLREQVLAMPGIREAGMQKLLKKENRTVTFRFSEDAETLIAHRPDVKVHIGLESDSIMPSGICLVTGERDSIARLHYSLEGIVDEPEAPARKYLVSFQDNRGLDSYGKNQGFNAPVGKRAAFTYFTALTHLLSSNQRLQVGDATTVFWAEQANRMESLLYQLLGEDSYQGSLAVKELFEAPKTGTPAIHDDGTRFYVLGLSPNAARAAVRFWHVATVGELAIHIRQHFKDLEIVQPRCVKNPFLSLKTLLTAVAPPSAKRPDGDIDNLPPKLAGDFMHAILNGLPYPQTILQAALTRIRAEQAKKQDNGKPAEHVTYARAALIKAWLNRHIRKHHPQEREIDMALDESCTNLGYRLGRLFAALERIQQDAAGGPDKINSTIRDSYFGSASSTPGAVFPTLIRRNQHHMTKLRKEKPGLYVVRDKLVQAILNEGLDGTIGFPTILSLPDQGRFVIGYYHQRQALFTKSESATDYQEESQ